MKPGDLVWIKMEHTHTHTIKVKSVDCLIKHNVELNTKEYNAIQFLLQKIYKQPEGHPQGSGLVLFCGDSAGYMGLFIL